MRGARMITQRSAGEADTTQSHPAVPDDRRPATARTLPGQPFAVKPAGLASVPGTWDKNDHGREGMPRNRYPARAHDSAAPPSLLSIRIHAEKESHPCL
jgi:hypothetical protein